MPETKYIQLIIDNEPIDLPQNEDVPVAVNFSFENEDDFSSKESTTAFDVMVPATKDSANKSNSFHHPSIEDMTSGEVFKAPRPFSLQANGQEIMTGKAFLSEAIHTDIPEGYKYNLYSDNADWLIDNSELTLADCMSNTPHTFSKAGVQSSWNFDGSSEKLDDVYAPVRYRQPWASGDTVVKLDHMKPSISLYWLLFRGFRKAGYKIVSNFFDTDYFRKLVLPWTWGDFKTVQLELAKFRARQSGTQTGWHTTAANGTYSFYMQDSLAISGYELDNTSTFGAHDNEGVYSWISPDTSRFTYPATLYSIYGSHS